MAGFLGPKEVQFRAYRTECTASMKLTSYVQDLGQTILLMENELRGTLTIALNAVKQKGNEEMLKIQVRNVQREGGY